MLRLLDLPESISMYQVYFVRAGGRDNMIILWDMSKITDNENSDALLSTDV